MKDIQFNWNDVLVQQLSLTKEELYLSLQHLVSIVLLWWDLTMS